MLELFVSAFVTFFVVIDPPGCAPIYAGLSARAGTVQRRAMAIRAVVVAGMILLVFALFGQAPPHGLGIELARLRTDRRNMPCSVTTPTAHASLALVSHD